MFIKFTQVDSLTGVPCTTAVMANGPRMPDIPGLKFDFALESQYPTNTPTYYGYCNDNVLANTPGILGVLTKPDYDAAKKAEFAARLSAAKLAAFAGIAAKRRMVEGGGITLREINGTVLSTPVVVQTEKEDQDRIDTALNNMERYKDTLKSVSFKAANNTWVDLSYDNLRVIGGLVVNHVQACFTAEKAHSMAVAQLTEAAAVQAYDYNTGWPAN